MQYHIHVQFHIYVLVFWGVCWTACKYLLLITRRLQMLQYWWLLQGDETSTLTSFDFLPPPSYIRFQIHELFGGGEMTFRALEDSFLRLCLTYVTQTDRSELNQGGFLQGGDSYRVMKSAPRHQSFCHCLVTVVAV